MSEKKPNVQNKEMEKLEKQFDKFEEEVKQMTLDRMNTAPHQDIEPQTKLSSREIEKSKEIYLKPKKSISCRDKFNEDYREQYNFAKEYVQFIAEHKEIIGESIDLWTRPFAGMPAEEWEVPVNKPVWGPRYLAEQIRRKFYHRLVMQPNVHSHEAGMQYYGTMAADVKIARLTAEPVSSRKSVFMGAAA
jgi:hypothetical protein